jgi:hypothetical protein
MARRVEPETLCAGCDVRFVPKWPPRRVGQPRFHSQHCASSYHVRMTPPDVLARRRVRGIAKSATLSKQQTERKWAALSTVVLQRALIDVRGDLTLAELQPVLRAMVKALRESWLRGWTCRDQRERRAKHAKNAAETREFAGECAPSRAIIAVPPDACDAERHLTITPTLEEVRPNG